MNPSADQPETPAKPFRRINRRIAVRVVLLYMAFSIALVAFACVLFYRFGIRTYSKMAGTIAQTIALSINGDAFAQKAEHGDPEPFDQHVRQLLANARTQTHVKFAYTVHQTMTGPPAYHAAGLYPDMPADPVPPDHFAPELGRTLITGRETYTGVYNPPRTAGAGPVISAFAPIHDSSERPVGAVGIDIPVDILQNNLADFRNRTLVFAIPLTLLLAAGFFYLTRRNFIKPIQVLSNAIAQLAGGGSELPPLPKRNDELGLMADNLAAVAKSVDSLTRGVDKFAEKQRLHEQQLRHAAETAEEASRMKSTFIATMSHEIRTPLNGIVGFTELAAADRETPAKTREYLRKIKSSAENLLHILNDILDISRIESGRLTRERVPFSLHEVFESCRDIVSPMANQKGLSLYFYAEPYVGKDLLGDPGKLRQILLNLLSNAVKFTNRGIVKLNAVVERSAANEATIHFEVKDSGIGMTPNQLKNIFEPFVQSDSDPARRHGAGAGAGLGLAITGNLLKFLGSKLEVESTRGLGSKFHFRLTFPTVDRPDAPPAAPEPDLPPPRLRGRVLVCEDNFINQEVLLENLNKLGLAADVAADGRVGVEMAEAARREGKPYDLILMDVHMPTMDGLEATERLRALENPSPIIAVTANVMHKDKEAYFKLGMVDCLGKPFLAQELWSILRRYLPEVDSVRERKKPSGRRNGTADVSPDAARADVSPPDADVPPPVLDRGLGLERAAGNEELYRRLLGTFADDHLDAAKNLKESLRAGDVDQALAIAHSMKGAAGMIGAGALCASARDLEARLREAAGEVGEEAVHAFERDLNAVLGEIASSRGEDGEDAPERADPERVAELLRRLAPLLEAGDPDCLETLERDRWLLVNSSAEGRKLVRQIESRDFEPALATLNRMLEEGERSEGR